MTISNFSSGAALIVLGALALYVTGRALIRYNWRTRYNTVSNLFEIEKG